MRELVVLSGKGGTGKTTVLGSLAALAEKAVLADCDVDAANLHLLLEPEIIATHEFYGQPQAVINRDVCTACGRCEAVCRFGAIADSQVDPGACEGCGVCVRNCPVQAITLETASRGAWYESNTTYGPLVHARLDPGEENSGLLVAEVKRRAEALAKERVAEMVLVDGPGGIGCPVTSALAGADLALLLTEPTLSGWHDLQRVLSLTHHFRVPAVVCLNKADLHAAEAARIEERCKQDGVQVIGRIPFDREVADAVVAGRPAVGGTGPAAQALRQLADEVWQRLLA